MITPEIALISEAGISLLLQIITTLMPYAIIVIVVLSIIAITFWILEHMSLDTVAFVGVIILVAILSIILLG